MSIMKIFHIIVSVACAIALIFAAFVFRGHPASTWIEASIIGIWLPLVLLNDRRSSCRGR